MKKTNNAGFSLVELIIVIAIMAVLIGVLAPQFIKFVEKSRESTDLQNVEEVKTAVETYVSDKGDTLTDTSITVTLTIGATGTILPSADLKEYGVATAGIKTKSTKWEPGTLVWTYHISDDPTKAYTWDIPTGSATYFKADGTDATAAGGGSGSGS